MSNQTMKSKKKKLNMLLRSKGQTISLAEPLGHNMHIQQRLVQKIH